MRCIDDPSELQGRYDLVIVGAGPAGMAAASTASSLGLDVLLADENSSPGGQIYRSVTITPVTKHEILGEHYWQGLTLTDELEKSACDYAPRTTVWSVAPSESAEVDRLFEVGISSGGGGTIVDASRIILATGALERPFCVPGWTLPGVMTAGAAQIALKSSGLVPEGRTVLAGCGPLLYLLASQLHAAGANVVGVLDTTPADNWKRALSSLPEFVYSPYVMTGLKLLATTRLKLRLQSGVTDLRILGETEAREVAYTRDGYERTLACDHVFLHHGVIPNINMPNALGCAQDWDDAQNAWRPRVDDWFNSTVEGISIAGDGAGIGGTESAAKRGAIAAFEAAYRLGRIDKSDRNRRAAPIRRELRRVVRGRRFLDLLYRPAKHFLAPRDPDTMVCRCEEVKAGQVREAAAKLGVTGPNQMKAFLRCGMGPCQGRLCGPTVIELMAETLGVSPETIGYYRLRIPVKPVTLGEIANVPQTEAANKACD